MKRVVLCFMFFFPILASASHIVLHNNTSKTFSVKMKERGFPVQAGSLSASGSRQFSLLGSSSDVVLIRLGDAVGDTDGIGLVGDTVGAGENSQLSP